MQFRMELAAAVRSGRPVVAFTIIAAPSSPVMEGRHALADASGLLFSEMADPALEAGLAAAAPGLMATGQAGLLVVGAVRLYAEPHLPLPELVVVGAGHVAQPVVQMAAMVGFRVTVVDDRLDYANPQRFPLADRIICDRFTTALRQLTVGSKQHFVLVTRGHRHDMDCLLELLQRPTAYLGMIGSRTRVRTVFRLLEEEQGVNPTHLAKVHAPIGLDIGARSPAEIAVSIVAELIKVKNGGTGDSLNRLERARVHGR